MADGKYPDLIIKPDPTALYGTPGTVGNAVSLDEKGISAEKELGNVTGVVSLNLNEASVFSSTLTGSTEFEVKKAPTEGNFPFVLYVKTEGHPFTIKNVSWVPSEPVFGAGEYYIALESRKGSQLIGFTGLKGEAGATGEKGAEGGTATGFYGDGSDGPVNMDGTNTFAAFATKSGKEYTLIRDVYATNFIIAAESTLKTASYRVFATGTFENLGIVKGPGGNAGGASTTATGGTGGAVSSEGTLKGARTGGKGATAGGSASEAGQGTTSGIGMGGAGGAGGAGSSTAAAAAGTILQTVAEGYPARNLQSAITGAGTKGAVISGGTGGGGGGAALTLQGGGGGGSAGGLIVIAAFTFNNKGTIECKGGIGGNANTVTASGGGGGGGGGGTVYLVYHILTAEGTLSVAGGTGGLGSNANGSEGAIGTIIKLKI